MKLIKILAIEFVAIIILTCILSTIWQHILPKYLANNFIIVFCPIIPLIIGMILFINKINAKFADKFE